MTHGETYVDRGPSRGGRGGKLYGDSPDRTGFAVATRGAAGRF
ncbi:MAG: hypothetical protein ACLTXI_02880 [Collinsella sp.]